MKNIQTLTYVLSFLQGQNLDAGSTEDDVTVYIGTETATISTLDESILTIILPDDDPGSICIDGNTTMYTCVVVSIQMQLIFHCWYFNHRNFWYFISDKHPPICLTLYLFYPLPSSTPTYPPTVLSINCLS